MEIKVHKKANVFRKKLLNSSYDTKKVFEYITLDAFALQPGEDRPGGAERGRQEKPRITG